MAIMRSATFFLLTLLLIGGCAAARVGIARNLETPEAMRVEVLAQIPPGSSAQTARDVLESNQFTCERRTAKPFDTDEFHREAFDHLLARRTDKAGPGKVRCWQVACEIHDEVVTDVYVKIGYTGR
jgi:hypothetical protein